MDGVRVLVVDDHQVFGDALARCLAAEHWVGEVRVAASAREAQAVAPEVTPDVVLVDQRLGDSTGIELVRWLREHVPDASSILLSAEVSDQVLLDAVEVGCAGVLTKSEPLDTVVGAVRGAVNGELAMSDELLARLVPLLRRRSSSADDLTEREREVLIEVAAGHVNAVIAEHLGLSVHTVRNHVATILRKLGAHSKLQAVAIATARGLLP